MGRDYQDELAHLKATRAWAASLDVVRWIEATRRSSSVPAIIVGSGGSIAAAHFAAGLYQRRHGHPAMVRTPLELLAQETLKDSDVWLLSAGGSNLDILAAWEAALDRHAAHVFVMCAQPDSLLASRARNHANATLIEFSVPSGRDGFLATNSLVAFMVLLARLFGEPVGKVQATEEWDLGFASSLDSKTLIVIHDAAQKPVAVDIESRFSESALGNVQVSDLRNFAHGRHVWLAKRATQSVVLILSTRESRDLAKSTMALLPPDVAVHHWAFDGEASATVMDGVIASMELASATARVIGRNPGRPGVPDWGSRLYGLGPEGITVERKRHCRAVEIKAGRSLSRLTRDAQLSSYESALHGFLEQLGRLRLSSVVLDFDGTLVDTRDRFAPVSEPVAEQLVRLLEEGMHLGIATGRGKSVHKALIDCIPAVLRSRVLVGYYNAGTIRSLAESPDGMSDGPLRPALERVEATLNAHPSIGRWKRELRPTQITVEARHLDLRERELWFRVSEVLAHAGHHDVKAVHSSHSLDILPLDVTKVAVVSHLQESASGDCIQIGDRGRWPGNDSELLALPNSLSVDDVSPDLRTCWNVLPSGFAGAAGTVSYLKAIRNGRFQFPLD
jgi:hypothetical protein